MMKRLMVGLLAGGLMTAMLPGVASAKSDNAAKVHGWTDGACTITTTEWTAVGSAHSVITSFGKVNGMCRLSPDDFTPAPPVGGHRTKIPGLQVVISPSGHGHVTIKP